MSYQVGNSRLHRMDARVKIITVLFLITAIVITPERAWLSYFCLWLVVVSLATLAAIGVAHLAVRGGMALPFALAAGTLLFTVPGRPLVTFFGLTVSDAGLARFTSIILKSWLSVQAAHLLTITTPFTDLLWAFKHLRVPAPLVEIIAFMLRYLFTLQAEAQSLLQARAARSATLPNHKSGGSLVWRARVAGGMVGNLFLRTYVRSERVYAAMLARGYNPNSPPIKPPPLPRHELRDALLLVMVLLLIEAIALT